MLKVLLKNLRFVIFVVFAIYLLPIASDAVKHEEGLKKLKTAGIKTTGTYEDQYKENTKNGAVVNYDFMYTFQVNNSTYKGTYITSSIPEIKSDKSVEVLYLKEDPTINTVNLESDMSAADGVSGIFKFLRYFCWAIIIGFSLVVGYSIFKYLKERDQPAKA